MLDTNHQDWYNFGVGWATAFWISIKRAYIDIGYND
tara:strand:- start:14 stop:121 length:108 start_codon:yes stop_codon:yes gene_type:complete